MTAGPGITVAVLTRNRLPLVQECVAAVLPQLESNDALVIVDTGSTDGTRAWLSSLPSPVRSVFLDTEQMDFAAARNAAVNSCYTDAIAFADDDCRPEPDWLQNIRKALQDHDAAGGLVLFGRKYSFPSWWSDELAWCVGMSGPRFIQGTPDDYPSTSSLAAWTGQFRSHPFGATGHSFGSSNIYLGGREDARWWEEARARGAATTRTLRAVVLHRIPQDRLRWNYVLQRARSDGYSGWVRNPCEARARRAALEWAGSVAAAAVFLFPSPRFSPARAAAAFVWSERQRSLIRAARANPVAGEVPARVSLLPALSQAVRARGAAAWFGVVRRSRPRFSAPEPPTRILVAAPTFLGDSVVLQPAVRLLAHQWPEAEIRVLTRYPRFFSRTGIRVVPTHDQELNRQIQNREWIPEIVFCPYYAYGDPQLWRRFLSVRGIAFDREMGFQRERDYRMAAKLVHKDLETHEILNLTRLVSAWPLRGPLEAPALESLPAALESVKAHYPELWEGRPFAAMQVRCGIGLKDWPQESWARAAAIFARESGLRLVFHDPAEEPGAADRLIKQAGLGSKDAMAVSCGLEELIALLSRASLAVGICSGPKHLAMALGTPTFTIYGPTTPERWGALFDRHLHGFVRTPAGDLTASELECLPVNHAMAQITPEAFCASLLAHWNSLPVGKGVS